MSQTDQIKQQPQPLRISIENQKLLFQTFLDLKDNERILFSGIFGIGKTYFLNQFFQVNDKFVSIHLYPTNYAVSTNEDIFEYIKFDILYELLSKGIKLEKIEVSKLQATTLLSSDEQFEIFTKFIETIPEIGKKVTDVIKPLKEIVDVINKKAKQVSIDEGKKLQEFAVQIGSKKGSIYENDFYSELITKLIDQLKESGKKQVVVIVDDLDRIDPEHIFRILNIFAVHFDGTRVSEYTNKFGIDKIILSCDVNNIRLMFGARYGIDTDFNGYIDKFYSREVYHFDNRQFISDAVEEITLTINYVNVDKRSEPWLKGKVLTPFLNYVLKSMIISQALNLRTLLRLFNKTLKFSKIILDFKSERYEPIYNSQLPITQIFDLLISLFETQHSALAALERSDFGTFDPKSLDSLKIYEYILIVSESGNHRFKTAIDQKLQEGINYSIHNLSTGIELSIQEKKDQRHMLDNHTFSAGQLKSKFDAAFKIYLNVKRRSSPEIN